ncbi:MAG: PAS domain-containing sensor histidine kinase [Pseudomonadales bacterium]|nr:PAS domain-containing sensor histidine kinase [Pseudomonadales bacterium]
MRAVVTKQDRDHTQGDLQSRLQKTFAAFNSISSQLTRSYLELEQRVDDLQQELAVADSERMRELGEKEALAERVRLIVNTMPVAVILLDGRGTIVQANAIAEALFEQSLVGARWIQVIQECFAPSPADGHEIALRNGKLVSLATQSMTHEPGQIIVLNDQTQTRRLQQKLNHHRKLSEMGRMTASLAHQIRTPLSTAILYADHLCSDRLPTHQRQRFAEKLRGQLLQLDQQVRDMLIFSRGGVVLDSVLPVSRLVELLQSMLQDYTRRFSLVVEVVSDVEAGAVRCNQELLLSVFSNLVENAVQACQGAGMAPRLELHCQIIVGGLLQLKLVDNGPGLNPQQLQQVMEPFFTTKSTGTGLGLPVVKAVVESHGGQFTLNNGQRRGVEACIVLPLMSADENNQTQARYA